VNKSLATFMMIAAVAIVMITLVIGVAFDSLNKKNKNHEDMLQHEHQLKIL
jgi:hypothetical protein